MKEAQERCNDWSADSIRVVLPPVGVRAKPFDLLRSFWSTGVKSGVEGGDDPRIDLEDDNSVKERQSDRLKGEDKN